MSGTDQITIRLPKARVAALRDAAKAQHRSLAQQVEHQLAATDAMPERSTLTPMVEDCVTTDEPGKAGGKR